MGLCPLLEDFYVLYTVDEKRNSEKILFSVIKWWLLIKKIRI